MTGNRNRVALITAHRIVHAQARGVNSNKVQHERSIVRAISAKIIRNKKLKDLVDYVKRCREKMQLLLEILTKVLVQKT